MNKFTFLSRTIITEIFDYFKCEKIEIEFTKKERVCIDGEIQEYEKLVFESVRDKINLAVPAIYVAQKLDRVAEKV